MIRFKKLKSVVKEKFCIDMMLHMSTELKVVACMRMLGFNKIEVLLNANVCKTEKDVLVAVAHELAHALSGSAEHNNDHQRLMCKVLNVFADEFGYSYEELLRVKEKLDMLAGKVNRGR